MPRSLLRAIGVAIVATMLYGCRSGPPEPMRLPKVDGSIAVDGLSAPVRIVRDRWGVPHVFAESSADLFFAQGFVQAQDRLFQMDLWRRAAQGRLAEVLGANFIERDAMTRRLQYHGDLNAEWDAYGAPTKAMAESFVAGINAWAAIARERTPELFALAGWRPDDWTAADLLNRTDAFDRQATIDAAAQRGLPDAVVDAVRRAAVPPFFTGLATRIGGAGPPKAAVDPAGAFPLPSPSPLYLIHLHAPQWSAVGATPPWRPGLTIGHDGTNSWARESPRVRADVRVESVDAPVEWVWKESIAVKGRAEPFALETRVTAKGVVIATDRVGRKQFALDWDGFRAGTSPAFLEGRVGQVGQVGDQEGAGSRVLFQHALAVTEAARARFNVGPLNRPAGNEPAFRVAWDPNLWDASHAINAPGQSEWRDSPHYSDLASLWSAGQMIPLVYSDNAINANREATLMLVPRGENRR